VVSWLAYKNRLAEGTDGEKHPGGHPVEGQLINAAADIFPLNIEELKEEVKSR